MTPVKINLLNRSTRRNIGKRMSKVNRILTSTCSNCLHINKRPTYVTANYGNTKKFKCSECNKLVVPLDTISIAYLLNPFYKIGFELEGVWKSRPKDEGTSHIVCRDDGSVRNYNTSSPFWTGEYVVVCKRFTTSNLEHLESIIRNNYPTETNESCGGHFHISFKDLRFYALLMELEFFQLMKENLLKWGQRRLNKEAYHKFENRLAGKSAPHNYCYSQDMFIPDSQVDRSNSERYTHLNFDYQKHQTLEVRLLPQFQSPLVYLEAVDNILTTMRTYIQSKFEYNHNENRIKTKKFDMSGQISTERIIQLSRGSSIDSL